jgi:hypothetical protein
MTCRPAIVLLLVLLLALVVRLPAVAAVYEVGTGQTYVTLSSLPSLSPGDVVEINPGTYNEVKRWTDAGTLANPITIRGVGATRPLIDATGLTVDGALPNPRAVFQIEASNVVVEHLEFVNARNGNNGAAVRVTSTGTTTTGVTISDCRLDHCDMGFMNDSCDQITLSACEIDDNGTASNSGYSHNFYLNGGATTLQGCYIHDALYGQNVKSRGHFTALLYCWIADSQDGEVGLVDSPGETAAADSNAVLIGNVIISKDRGAGWNDERFILFGQDEGGAHSGTIYVINNTCIAGAATNTFLWSNWPSAAIVAENNIFTGSDIILNPASTGPATGSGCWMSSGAVPPAGFTGSVQGAAPGFVDQATLDLTLTAVSPCRGIGVAAPTYVDGAGATQAGTPTLSYQALGMLVARANPSSGLDAGAYSSVAGSGPLVAITAPAPAATFTAPATIAIQASASEAGGTIARVDFYQGGVLIGSASAAPYVISWYPVPAGSYLLTAVATDGANAATTSSSIAVTVTAAAAATISVALTSPAAAETVTAPATISLAASASDSAGTITVVDYYQGGTLVGSSSTPPYAASWNAVPAGTCVLTALAHDSLGGSAISASVTVTVTPAAAGGAASSSAPSSSGSHPCGLGAGVASLLMAALALARGARGGVAPVRAAAAARPSRAARGGERHR